MNLVTSRSIPPWVAQSVETVFRKLPARGGEVFESYRSARWDFVVRLENGTEVLAWVDRPDQTPSRVEAILEQAVTEAGF